MAPIIEVTDLSWAYGESKILNNIDFQVKDSSFFTIIGPNGSGKSTLMRLIAGILKTYSGGDIRILGKSINLYSVRILAQIVSYVPQSVSLEFPFSVEEFVLLGRSPHQGILGITTDEDYDIVRQSMIFTDTLHLSQRRMNQISGGERQRVFIARAICQQPNIMLLDEPASALDFSHQIGLMDLLDRIRVENNVAIVMISHDINLSAIYADTMLLLSMGKAIRIGTPEQVLDINILESVFKCPFISEANPLHPVVPMIFPIPEKYRKKTQHP